MQSPLGWLLLLACVLVQGLVTLRGTRAALAGSGVVALSYLVVVLREPGQAMAASLATLAFVLASGVIILAHRRTATHIGQLVDLCDIDETTECLNRRGFSRSLLRLTAESRRSGEEIALIALDLDHFKQVNDRYGHLTGDDVLHQVGRLLVDAVGSRGVVARMGGEEFAALLPSIDAEGAGVMAEHILQEVRTNHFASLPPDARLTMSAGIAVERVTTPDEGAALRARADEALYAAKRSGRDRALLWPPGVPSNTTPSGSLPVIYRASGRRTSGGSTERPSG